MEKQDIALAVDHVGMKFNLSKEKVDNLKEYFIKFIKKELTYQEFWALKDVTFDVKRGEHLGIVGLNGAGKSTLLRMITGVFDADSGEIIIDGKSIKKDVSAKELFFFIPDEPYFFENATPRDMERYYKSVFTQFNSEQYYDCCAKL